MEDAFRFMAENGYDAVKTGYVVSDHEHHDGQWMVNHYLRVVETAARYKAMVNSHEAVRPTGLCRLTHLSNQLVEPSLNRSTEIHPNTQPSYPSTRLMGDRWITGETLRETCQYMAVIRSSSTLVKQLALYVTMYSPLQMVADLYQNYEKYSYVFQFIKDVSADRHTLLEENRGGYSP